MDRRRIILIAIVIMGVLAVGDIYVNGIGMFEQFGLGFTFRIVGEAPNLRFSTATSYPAAEIEKLELRAEAASVKLVADDVDTFSIEAQITVYAESDEAAHQLMKEARIETAVEGGVLKPRLDATLPPGVRKTHVTWQITAPRNVEVDVDYRWGTVTISGVTAPVTVTVAAIGTVDIVDVTGPVHVRNEAGTVSLEQIQGDVQVDSGLGEIEIYSVTGNVDVKSSAGSVVVQDVTGYVVLEGAMGELKADRIEGPVRAHQEFGDLRVTNVTGEIGVSVRAGSAYIEPAAAAPITAVVSQGDLTLSLSESLAQQYRFAFDADRISMNPALAARQQAQDGHLIDVTVRTGMLRIVQ